LSFAIKYATCPPPPMPTITKIVMKSMAPPT
jgi:hypothetical protein